MSSAECLAAQAQAEGLSGRVKVVIDAQRNEFYLAGYDLSPAGPREVEPLRLASLADVQQRLRCRRRPSSAPKSPAGFPAAAWSFPARSALGHLALGRSDFIPGENLQPIYLRETKFVKAPPSRPLP